MEISNSFKKYYEGEAKFKKFLPHEDDTEEIRTKLAISLIPKDVKSVLDLGCGDGYLCSILSKKIKNVAGLDLSETRIKRAKKRFKGLNFRTGNILNLPYDDNSFEAVLAVEVLEHIPNLRKAIKEMSRVSSKYIIFTVPHKQKPRKVLCPHCLKKFYAEGHINYFDDDVIKKLSSENNLKLLKQRKINIIPYLNFELYPEIIKRIMNSLFIKFSAYFIAVLLKKESK